MSGVSAQIYDVNLTAGQSKELLVSGSYYRIRTNTGNVGIRRDGGSVLQPLSTGQGETGVNFNRLTITDLSGATNNVTIIVSDSTFVDAQLLGTVSITASQVLQMIRPEAPTGFFSDTSALTINTPVMIVAPAANINGIILLSASMSAFLAAAVAMQAFITKASAPASVVDGTVMLASQLVSQAAGAIYSGNTLPAPAFVPAGQGLYFISSATTAAGPSTNDMRVCRYKVL